MLVLNVLALKLLFFKLIIWALTIIGISNPSLTDIFARMDNICIDNSPIIAQQSCSKNFATIQDAVTYLETNVDPDTDTIYNAQYYSIIKDMLGNYCGDQIDQTKVATETKKLTDINKQKDSGTRITLWKQAHDNWKQQSLQNNTSDDKSYCNGEYLIYDMLDLSQKWFLKELNKQQLLSPTPIVAGQKLSKTADKLVLAGFAQRKTASSTEIHSTIGDLGTPNANAMASIIRNISLSAVDNAINSLHTIGALTDDEKSLIKNKMELNFTPSCGKNQWYHKINQYYDNNDVLQKTTLEEIKLDIPLCDSYQYIEPLSTQVQNLAIHEIGHYIYYFKDSSPSSFESLCRNSRGKTCDASEFVSNYAQTNAQEDYAETFSRRWITKINKDKKYLAYYTHTPANPLASNSKTLTTSSSHGSASDATELSKKFSYFDALVKKF